MHLHSQTAYFNFSGKAGAYQMCKLLGWMNLLVTNSLAYDGTDLNIAQVSFKVLWWNLLNFWHSSYDHYLGWHVITRKSSPKSQTTLAIMRPLQSNDPKKFLTSLFNTSQCPRIFKLKFFVSRFVKTRTGANVIKRFMHTIYECL